MAHGALVHVTGGDITLEVVARAGELVTTSLPQDVRLVWGARVDPLNGKVRVMVVLTGVESTFGEMPKMAQAPVQEEKKRRFLEMFGGAPFLFFICGEQAIRNESSGGMCRLEFRGREGTV